jgi:hypothetical protein
MTKESLRNVCPACRRRVDELREIVIADGESVIRLIRCVECMDVAERMIPQFMKSGES